jgi:hypothetical protein
VLLLMPVRSGWLLARLGWLGWLLLLLLLPNITDRSRDRCSGPGWLPGELGWLLLGWAGQAGLTRRAAAGRLGCWRLLLPAMDFDRSAGPG